MSSTLNHRHIEHLDRLVPLYPKVADAKDFETVKRAYRLIEEASKFVNRFHDCLSLIEFCDAQHDTLRAEFPPSRLASEGWDDYVAKDQPTQGWSRIAERDGGLTLYDFVSSLRRAKKLREQSPALKGMATETDLKLVLSAFSKSFPDVDPVRHGLAHPGTLLASEADEVRNSVTGDLAAAGGEIVHQGDGKMVLNNLVLGRTVYLTIENSVASYTLDNASWQAMLKTYVDFCAAFAHRPGVYRQTLDDVLRHR